MEKPHMLLLALDDTDGAMIHESSPMKEHYGGSESLVYRRIHRQVVQRGLARHRGDSSTKESHQRARMTRLERQIAIVEKFHREKARQETGARLEGRGQDAEARKGTSLASSVVAAQQAPRFSRKVNLRQLPSSQAHLQSTNQLEDSPGKPSENAAGSPKATDIESFAILASHLGTSRHGPTLSQLPAEDRTHGLPSSSSKKAKKTLSRAHADKSMAQVLWELKITKEIMMREYLVKQIHEIAASVNELGTDLYNLAQRQAKIDGSTGNGVSAAASRRPSSTTPGTAVQAGSFTKQQQKIGDGVVTLSDADRRELDLPEWEAKSGDLIERSQHRVTQLHRLVASLQSTTIDLVESILEWRANTQSSSAISNVEKLHRFAWKQCNIANYLLHIDSDLRDLFPSAAMGILLGATAKYNPLLLSRVVLDVLGIPDDSFVSTTFLTDREGIRPLESSDASGLPSPTRRQTYVALQNAVRTGDFTSVMAASPTQLDAERLRRCLEAIQEEHEMERHALERLAVDKQRLASAYNPFESIRNAGGVEDAIANVLSQQVEAETIERAEQLRRRQKDTSRAKPNARGPGTNAEDPLTRPHPLYVSPGRIRKLMEQRKEVREAATDCALNDTTASWKKNKLRGQFMVRKMNIRRMENQHARKIQRQFLAYRRRTQLLKNLAQFVLTSRQRVVTIQKVVKGFIAKKRYQATKQFQAEQRQRRFAAKLIWHTYKRYKRRQRHRHSMSVETVAQIQLFQVIQHQLEDAASDTSSAERYRKVGEERRRQRAVHMLKRRQELLELEAKRAVAAARIQSMYRVYLAKKMVLMLRGERRAHMSAVSAMMIQSKIRTFLKKQEKRRQGFRNDMERVNRSAARIQSIYHGYQSRVSLRDELDQRSGTLQTSGPLVIEGDDGDDDCSTNTDEDDAQDDTAEPRGRSYTVLPQILNNSRPSTGSSTKDTLATPMAQVDRVASKEADAGIEPSAKLSLPPIRPQAQSVEHPPPTSGQRKAQPPPSERRQLSNGMMKVELKLKGTTLGENLEASSHATSSGGFLGGHRRRVSATQTGSSVRRNSSDSGSNSGNSSARVAGAPSNF